MFVGIGTQSLLPLEELQLEIVCTIPTESVSRLWTQIFSAYLASFCTKGSPTKQAWHNYKHKLIFRAQIQILQGQNTKSFCEWKSPHRKYHSRCYTYSTSLSSGIAKCQVKCNSVLKVCGTQHLPQVCVCIILRQLSGHEFLVTNHLYCVEKQAKVLHTCRVPDYIYKLSSFAPENTRSACTIARWLTQHSKALF